MSYGTATEINIWYSNSILQFIKLVTKVFKVTIRFNEGNNSDDNRRTRINVVRIYYNL